MAGIAKIQLKTQHLILYTELDQGMVFHTIKQSLYQLPPLSISLLLAIDEGLNKQAVIDKISALSQLAKAKLLAPYDKVAALFSTQIEPAAYIDGKYPEFFTAISSCLVAEKSQFNTYQIAQTTFLIETNHKELCEEISKLLAPCKQTKAEVDFQITIEEASENPNLFTIVNNGLKIENNLPLDHVLPHLIDRLQILSFQKTNYQYCFHGAAIKTEFGNLLLPGSSGAGKSTLSAILANDNSALFSDEMIVLDDHFQLTTINLPIAIKSGSWPYLMDIYPELKSQTVWQREDGRKLKYIWPLNFAQEEQTTAVNKTLLINPCYKKSADKHEAHQVELSIIDTITLMTKGGYQVAHQLTDVKVERLINFLAKVSCYKITYQSSEQALITLKQLWQDQK
ncbi:hypothetical protein AADZ91_04445 [Colwelliaceae bacterium 6441]